MRTNTYLTFNGQCEEAFKFYQTALGAEISAMMPFEGSPMAENLPAEWRTKVMHAAMTIGGDIVMGSDGMPGRYEKPQGFAISLQIGDPAKAEKAFNALAEGGTTMMPLEETFWALRFGMVTDRFGIPWMVNCDRPE